MAVAAAVPAALAQDSADLFREIAAANLSATDDAAGLEGPSVVRSRYVEVNVARILPETGADEPTPSRARGGSSRRLSFNLFPDAVLEFDEDRGEYLPDGTFVWHSRATQGGGQALLVVRDGIVAGSVRTDAGEFYRIRNVSSQVHVIRQVTYQGTPAVEDAVPVPESEIPQVARAQQDVPVAEQSGTTTLDILVVYTAGARQAAGGTSGIQSEINLAIQELNQSYTNSGVQMQARLAHAAEIAYNDEQNSLSTSLSRLRSPVDGYMDQAHTLRDQYGADVVALLVNGPGSSGGTVGTGYIMQTVGSYFAAYAFSVTEVNFATGPSYALLHEIGHNLGLAHDRDNASSGGAYSYSYGYQRSQTPRFRTIMSYNCSGVNCPTVNHWSNPNVNYSGYPTGVASSQSNSADNRQTLNNTRVTAAAWRQAVAANSSPSVVGVSPSSGSGASQTFTASFTDSNGASDVRYTYMLINSGLTWAGSCGLRYDRLANQLQIINDQGSGWQGNIAPGSGTLSNGACAVNGGGFAVNSSGNTLTQSVAVNFGSGFGGGKYVFLNVSDIADASSGWQLGGTWTVPAGGGSEPVAPIANSISPSSGSGSSQTFTLQYADGNGAGNIQYTYVLMNSGLTWVGACGFRYDRAANRLQIINDQGSGWQGGITPGSGTLSNSKCTVNGSAFSVSSSGNTLTQSFATSFTPAFSGSKNLYMYVSDNSGAASGWYQRGTWTVPGSSGSSPVAPTTVSISPSSGTGSSQTFTAAFSDGNGANDIQYTYVLMNSGLTWVGACGTRYDRAANLLQIINDQGSGWQGGIHPGSGTLSNSRCTISGSGFSVSSSGTTLTQSFATNFSSGFTGTKQLYLYTSDNGGAASGWALAGSWTASDSGGSGGSPAAPSVDSITPSSGSGANQAFTARFSDGNGANDLRYTYVLMNSGLSWVGSCGLRYDRLANVLQIINDQGSGWQGGITPGSGVLSNSRCTVYGSGFSVSASGNVLTQSFSVSFSSAFKGNHSIYLEASDKAGASAGWRLRGTWTVP